MTEVWLFEAMYTARALRRLKPDPVPEGLITTVPMRRSGRHLGGNAQNWCFIVVPDYALWRRLAAVLSKSFG